MSNGNRSLDGIDRDLRHQELQDPTFIFKGETIETLSDFLLEHGKVLYQPEVLVLLLALVYKTRTYKRLRSFMPSATRAGKSRRWLR